MALTVQDVMQTVLNDAEFCKFVSAERDLSAKEVHERLITVPRSSFTALHLQFSTTKQMEAASKVILIGGIPERWPTNSTRKSQRTTYHANTNFCRAMLLASPYYGYHSYRRRFSRQISMELAQKTARYNIMRRSSVRGSELQQTIKKNNDSPTNFRKGFCKHKPTKYKPYHNLHAATSTPELSARHREYQMQNSSAGNTAASQQLQLVANCNKSTDNIEMISHVRIKSSDHEVNQTRPTMDNYKSFGTLVTQTQKLRLLPQGTISSKTMKSYLSLLSKRDLQLLTPEPSSLDTVEHRALANELTQPKKHMDEYMREMSEKAGSNLKEKLPKLFDNHKPKQEVTAEFTTVLSDQLLVINKIAENVKLPINDFSDLEPVDTRVQSRWKEYRAIASVNQEQSVIIQLFDSCNTKEHIKNKKSTIKLTLDHTCCIKLYSHLDRTLSIQVPDPMLSRRPKKGILKGKTLEDLKIFIFKFSNVATANKWYLTLQQSAFKHIVQHPLILTLPDLNLSVRLNMVPEILKEITSRANKDRTTVTFFTQPKGYFALPSYFWRYILITIIQSSRTNLSKTQIPFWQILTQSLGCSLRFFDRLEWYSVFNSSFLENIYSLYESHAIEIRPYRQYPTEIITSSANILQEPTSVEGFLLQVSKTDKLRNYQFRIKDPIIPLYMVTADNLLFYMPHNRAKPPYPLKRPSLRMPNSVFSSLRSTIYENSPYTLDDSEHISWLDNDPSIFRTYDQYASNCFKRRVSLLLRSEAVIDMTEIEDISLENMNAEMKLKLMSHVNSKFWETDTSLVISIKIKGSLTLRLIAVNDVIGNEWVTRLQHLVSYWKLRILQDGKELWQMKLENMKNCGNDEISNSNKQNAATNDRIYNANSLTFFRPIVHKGRLYVKYRKHSRFTKYYTLLVPGYLIFFDAKQSKCGTKWLTEYSHYTTIPIVGAYVYSGTLTARDLLNRDNTFDYKKPGCQALPRVYSDGWHSNEDEISRCFAMWVPKQDVRSKHAKRSSGTIVCMARSKQERDLWVLSLTNVLDKINR